MVDTPIVKINSDPPEKIIELYGIGSVLANRIVKHRETVGYFQSPNDLAKVDGVNIDLATTLAPHINWEIPSLPEQPVKWDLPYVALGIASIVYIVWLLFQVFLPALLLSLQNHQNGMPSAWTDVWANASKIMVCFWIIAGIILFLVSDRTANQQKHRLFLRLGWICSGLSIISGFSVFIGRLLKYQLYDHSVWESSARWVSLLGFLLGAIIVFPILLVSWKSTSRNSLYLARMVDFSIPALAFISGLWVWVSKDSLPIGILIIVSLSGISLAYIGISLLRSNDSFFMWLNKEISNSEKLRRGSETHNWQAWINARLPDPEQQKALKEALDKTYPPSKWRTVSSTIILGAGGWILLTAISGIIQWFVEKGMDKLFHNPL